ncbi:MAG TPA: aldose 1-epimerase family protein [Thermoguttaceae bacterium]|nr:aldose 1-epimerase family protein [Thermoguttaceae bacterium]
MSKKTWTLTDVDQDVYVECFTVGPNDVGGPATGYRIVKRRLYGGLRDGVDVVEVDNGLLRFVVVPTRGMGIWRARIADMTLGWQSPVKGPVHPAFVRLNEASGIGWLDGFDELVCRCGLESNGAPEFHEDGRLRYSLHGKIANCPAQKLDLSIDGDSGLITILGVVDEARLFGNKLRMTSTITTRVGQPSFTITDVVTNISAEPGELELLYHINVGAPLLEPGAKLVAAFQKMAPHNDVAVGNLPDWDTYGPETPGAPEACFFYDLAADADGQTQVLLHNAAASRGVSVAFNKRQLPYFIQWKNRQAVIDGYVTGMEPATNFPNNKSFEKAKGRVVVLPPGGSRTFQVTLQAHPTPEAVAAAKTEVEKLQQNAPREILPKPNPDWSRGA